MLRLQRFSDVLFSACAGVFACFVLAGCGGDEHHPDTGYGKDQPVPSTVNCADYCRREGDCGGHLCAEDKGNDAYLGLSAVLEPSCLSSCPADTLTSKITSTMWECLFKSSCRQVYESDACHVGAYFYCK